MSYILDALKKSEQERQQGSNPSLQTIHRPQPRNNSSSGRLKVALLLMGLVVIALSYREYFHSTGGQAELQATANNVSSVTSAAEQQAIVAQEMPEQKVHAVVEFWQLPDPVQSAIPALTFSFHVYSDNPQRRTIIINKKRVREGDALSDQLQLIEITKKGVVLAWQQHQFHIAVIDDW